MQDLVIGAIGHRFLAQVDRVVEGIDRALDTLAQSFPNRSWIALSMMAEGADQLIVERMLLKDPNVRLMILLPFARDQYLLNFDSDSSKRTFTQMLRRADDIIQLPTKGTLEAAFLKAGKYILQHSDVLISVWDGETAQGTGGTGEIIDYARGKKMPIAWVHAGNRKPGTHIPMSLGADQGKVTFENVPQ
jgi:hypothetical protein